MTKTIANCDKSRIIQERINGAARPTRAKTGRTGSAICRFCFFFFWWDHKITSGVEHPARGDEPRDYGGQQLPVHTQVDCFRICTIPRAPLFATREWITLNSKLVACPRAQFRADSLFAGYFKV